VFRWLREIGERRRQREREKVAALKARAAEANQLKKLALCAAGYKVPARMTEYAQFQLLKRLDPVDAAQLIADVLAGTKIKWDAKTGTPVGSTPAPAKRSTPQRSGTKTARRSAPARKRSGSTTSRRRAA
jgi:hypothetical protein